MKPLANAGISIVIAVYNDWAALDSCLKSIELQTTDQQLNERQRNVPRIEIVVVADGRSVSAPEAIQIWERRLPLTIVRQAHAGISAARNRGIQTSTGS